MERVFAIRDTRLISPRISSAVGNGSYRATDNVELALNGAFASGASWSLGAISAISGGVLTATAGADGTYNDTNTGTSLKAATTYLIKYDITANTSTGTFTLQIGSASSFPAALSTTVGTNKSFYFTPDITGAITIRWVLSGAANLISLDNLSVMAVTNP